MFGSNFNDDEYEGINLKIPYWFYNINKEQLGPILENLKDFLENKALSHMTLENRRNISELENIESKKQVMLDRFDQEKKRKDELQKQKDDLLNGNVYEIEWVKKSAFINVDNGLHFITKDGKEYDFRTEEIVTKKYGISQKIIKLYEEIKDNLDIDKLYGFNISGHLTYYQQYGKIIPHENVRLENLSSDVWNIRITYSIKNIKKYELRKGKLYYTTKELHKDVETGRPCFYMDKDAGFIFLDNYEEKFNKLRKRDEI